MLQKYLKVRLIFDFCVTVTFLQNIYKVHVIAVWEPI